ncbi:N-formylglutamate amidohydrolase [Candidatus Woesearchaeota archaeon]|nr:N-formylglutamate amidohydrolase [Candidatus Woesearchaeota archaeon]
MKKEKLNEIFHTISPILINAKKTSITVGLSKRFLLFQLMNHLTRRIEDEPYLNFISVLKNYKILGRFLNGHIKDLYRDRNKSYFKNFFMDRKLYELVKQDLEWVWEKHKDLKLTITKRGIIIYDNYEPNNFNVLLLTIHSGTWLPKDIQKKQIMSPEKRRLEEDIDTHKLYSPLVLDKRGIWIDCKNSRFACDYNRGPETAIYKNNSERFVKELWTQELTGKQRKELMKGYAEFYFTLGHLIETYKFNIIFDGHSMRDTKTRPMMSFGTHYIPKFYMPIVRSMQRKLNNMGYEPVRLNDPYEGGYILNWMHKRYPEVFTFSMEINKKLYMTRDRRKTIQKRMRKVSENLQQIFDIEDEADVIKKD